MGMNKESQFPDDATFREYAWSYFQLHAHQRLQAVQFFVTLATAIVGGMLLLFREGRGPKWTAALGFLLAFLSFVFWKLDIRTRTLVKNAEDALKFLDSRRELGDIDGVPHPLALFARDDYFVSQANQLRHFSYRRCFNYIFLVFGIGGLVAGLACLVYLP